MNAQEAKQYILDHWQDHTIWMLAEAIGKSKPHTFNLCKQIGIKPPTPAELKISLIKGAEGKLTAEELAQQADCHVSLIRKLCKQHNLPCKPERCGGFREGHKTGKRRRPLMEPPPHPDPPKVIQRPKAVYDNPNYSDYIDQLLQS